jgi:arylsulfatase A-like enzyme
MKHCYTLFDTDILTPLAMRIPGVDGIEIAAPVQNLDLVPTLLDLLGVDTAKFQFEGKSRRDLIEGASPGDKPDYAFAMQGAARSITDAQYKLRFNAQRKQFNLHDLSADPLEQYDVLRENAETFLRLQGALEGWETKVARGKSAQELARVGEEVQDRLRALGYLQ